MLAELGLLSLWCLAGAVLFSLAVWVSGAAEALGDVDFGVGNEQATRAKRRPWHDLL